jgi:D-alanine transaminase
MSRYAYVNGRYLPMRDASVHVEDRGYQFADGVYEVCEVRAGRLIDARRHLDRLQRSLDALHIRMPMSRAALETILREVVGRNRVSHGLVYLQITRGVAKRDHAFPKPDVPPSLVVTARGTSMARTEALAAGGIAVITVPDNRWGRVDIKTVGLLPNVLARQAAIEQGARDAWFVDNDGNVTEADHAILGGITRAVLFDAVRGEKLRVEERVFSVAEALAAREAFVTSATQAVMPVVRIDGRPVGDGRPGPVAAALRRQFHHYAEAG